MPQKRVEGKTGRRVSGALRPKATLLTFFSSYEVRQNFVLLPVSVASPLNNITLMVATGLTVIMQRFQFLPFFGKLKDSCEIN